MGLMILSESDKELLAEVLLLTGDDPKEIDSAVRKVLGRHFAGPKYQGTRGYMYRLLTRYAKKKIKAIRDAADRAASRRILSH